MLFKILGSVLIISCGMFFGLRERAKFASKVNIVKELLNSLEFIHSEISCMCTPTEELLNKLCKIGNCEVKKFFTECKNNHIARKDLPFALVWSRTLKNAVYLELSENEADTMQEVGNALGRYDAEEQLRVLKHSIKSYQKYLVSAEETRGKLGKLYGNLSLISGIALVIILL